MHVDKGVPNVTVSTIVSSAGEPLSVGAATLDANRRHVVARIVGGSAGVADHWELTPAGTTACFRIRHAESRELMYVGSRALDASRRRVVTWVGGGDVEGDAAVWELCRAEGPPNRFRLRNMDTNEYLYVGSNTLDAENRLALTWIGNINDDPSAVWTISGMAEAPGGGVDVDGLPAFSPNAQALLDAARGEAARRCHRAVGTEHILWALLQPGCSARIVGWLGQKIVAPEDGSTWQEQLLERLEANPLFTPAAARPCEPVLGRSLREVFETILRFASGPVNDGDVCIVEGLVATEFIVAGIMLHGVNTAAELLGRASRGQVDSWTIFSAIGVDPTRIHVERTALLEVASFSTGAAAPDLGIAGAGGFALGSDLPDPRALPVSPTHTSNWLVPGSLIIGAHPSSDDVQALMAAGVTTFVSLIGEYTTEEYRKQRYPAEVAAHFVHFPINDFHVPVVEELESIVLELKLRLTQRREVIFVHCRGGHGRTGTVVIPLMAALFDLDDVAATQYVVTATSTNRPSDMRWGADMPETAAQAKSTRAANARVRMQSRKGR